MNSHVFKDALLGFQVWSGDLNTCIDQIAESVRGANEGSWLACLNPHSYAMSLDRRSFQDALNAAHFLIPDGIGVVMASRIVKGRIRRRITGSDIFWTLNERLDLSGGANVFFLGTTEETLDVITKRYGTDWPHLKVVGTFAPPFKNRFDDGDLQAMADAVNRASPDVLWVGLSAPKQEELIHALWPRIHVRFAAAVGAVFDFYSGRVTRSSPLFQRLGLEWLPRLVQEPRRLWRRMFVSAPIFLGAVIRQRLRKR